MIFLHPAETAARDLVAKTPKGPIVMVNLLRFRDLADYGDCPALAPPAPITGAEAYRRYADAILPLLHASGGTVIHDGHAAGWFIGPENERWDHVLIVRQASLQTFLAFASDPAAQAVQGHRTAALADSRLLPSIPSAASTDTADSPAPTSGRKYPNGM